MGPLQRPPTGPAVHIRLADGDRRHLAAPARAAMAAVAVAIAVGTEAGEPAW